ncbi:MAG TPA: GUN4 domain-containing protein [Thermomonospora sp.]|nr:GUN4 domain-containing protein [Thermomonospora sp.]
MPLVDRFVLGVDIKGFSLLPHGRQARLQEALARVLDAAAETAGIDRERWERRGEGDGEVAVLPPDTDLTAMVRRWTAALDERLADHNDDHSPEMRLRLRVAMHIDSLTPGTLGHTGPALIVLARLLNCGPVRAALEAAPDAHLALIISEPLYRKTVEAELDGLRPWQFERVTVDVKTFHGTAYVHVPRGTLRPAPRPAPPPFPFPVPVVRPDPVGAAGATETVVAPPEPEPEPEPPPALDRAVLGLLDDLRAALAAGDVARADLLTTRTLLEAAGRRRQGWLRDGDCARLPDTLFTEIDRAWREASGGRWGFAAQRARTAGVPLSGRRGELRRISVLLGWHAEVDALIPGYAELVRRGDRDGPFYPTLRDPEAESHPGWDDEWSSTARSVHLRLQDWER